MDQREEPGKQKTRSRRAQQLARSRAQENAGEKKVKYRRSAESAKGENVRRELSAVRICDSVAIPVGHFS
jgi:hypothetical protein